MRVAVTGAHGFTGRYVTHALRAASIDHLHLSCDLTDPAEVENAVERETFDRVIHLAGSAFVGEADWRGFYAVNQLGTFNLLDAVARIRPGTRLILASSAQVYGPGAEGLIAEEAGTDPANHYAVSKLAMETGAKLWEKWLDIVVTRPFNYTGVGQGDQYLVPKIVDHFARRAPTIELGNTWVKRDFGDVRAVADAYVDLALADAVPALLNISTGIVTSVDEIVSLLSEISGHSIDVKTNPAFVRTNDVPVLGGDNKRLRNALPQWRSYELQDTLAWMYRESTKGAGTSEQDQTSASEPGAR